MNRFPASSGSQLPRLQPPSRYTYPRKTTLLEVIREVPPYGSWEPVFFFKKIISFYKNIESKTASQTDNEADAKLIYIDSNAIQCNTSHYANRERCSSSSFIRSRQAGQVSLARHAGRRLVFRGYRGAWNPNAGIGSRIAFKAQVLLSQGRRWNQDLAHRVEFQVVA